MITLSESDRGVLLVGSALPPYPGRWMFSTGYPRSLRIAGYLEKIRRVRQESPGKHARIAGIVEIGRVRAPAVDEDHQMESPRVRFCSFEETR